MDPFNSDDKSKKVYYDPKLPKNFFDDTYLKPEFYQPENHDLEITTHNSIRNTLFYQTTSIKQIEYYHLKHKEDYFKFLEIKNLQPNLIDRINQLYDKDVKLIGIKEFLYQRNNKIKRYKVKYYHDLKNECFYCKVIPINVFDKFLKYYYSFSKK